MLARWRLLPCSASLNRRSKNVIAEAIIVPELELCNVKMQVFLTDIMESANIATLEEARDETAAKAMVRGSSRRRNKPAR